MSLQPSSADPFRASVLDASFEELELYPGALRRQMLQSLGNVLSTHADVVLNLYDIAKIRVLLPAWKIGGILVDSIDGKGEVTQKSVNVVERQASELRPPDELLGLAGMGAVIGVRDLPTERSRVTMLSRRALRAGDIARVVSIEEFFCASEEKAKEKRRLEEIKNNPKPLSPITVGSEVTAPKPNNIQRPVTLQERTDLSNLPVSLKATETQLSVLKDILLTYKVIADRDGKEYDSVKGQFNLLKTENCLSLEQLFAVGVREELIDLSSLPPKTNEPLTDMEKLLLPVILGTREEMAKHCHTGISQIRTKYLKELQAKLGVNTRNEAYLVGLRDGYIEIPPVGQEEPAE